MDLKTAIEMHNKGYMQEYPEYGNIGTVSTDLDHWKALGVNTACDFVEYQDIIECWSDRMKDINGFRPRYTPTLSGLRNDDKYINSHYEEERSVEEYIYTPVELPNNGITF